MGHWFSKDLINLSLPKDKRLVLAVSVVFGVLFIVGAFGVYLSDYRASPVVAADKAAVIYELPAGRSLRGVAQDLNRAGILPHQRLFILLGKLEDKAQYLKAGEYEFGPGTTPGDILETLYNGDVVQYDLTIVEGWTFKEVMEAIRARHKITQTLRGLTPDQIMAKLGHPTEHPEGRFFPETYHFPKGTPDTQILNRAYDAMQTSLITLWATRAPDLPYQSPYDALIVASMIEKETAVPSERPRIAEVLVRRIESDMPLQIDPTVIYGLGKDYKGKLHRRDLRKNTPYNTYLHRGLPPTPIAMPRFESIFAALHPSGEQVLYFVAKGDGRHVFSATLQEHHKAVKKYRQFLAENADENAKAL